MTGFFAYLKKELWEQIITFRLWIICAVFFMLGIISPIGAKYTPEILKTLTKGSIAVQVAEPTYIDSFVQYFKNLSQLGLVVFIILFHNVLSQEIVKGILIIPMSKGLSSKAVINAKFVGLVFSWTVSFGISYLSCILYTKLLFHKMYADGVGMLSIGMWLFGIFLISLILFCNVVCRGGYISLLLIAAFVGGMFLLNLIPDISEYVPLSLVNADVSAMLSGQKYEMMQSGVVTCICSVLFLLFSYIVAKSRSFVN